ncbi:MAG: 4Fe-4S binding protein [Desulfovibrio sp.]|uniref:ATP-binding protein n=1 Tax=Desulfovibrio sp. TaxID=885 RepID=UPI001A709A4D|nr:4Fe-4S binding protein [Desulfovibrio sp.]MBD5417136.1 4Fe-4S binding protein [Desulfovibrio sp.]
MPPVIDEEKCVHCQLCAEICPLGVFLKHPDEAPQVAFPNECWHCNACVLDCPSGALSLRMPLPYLLLHVDAKKLLSNQE